MNFTLYHGDCLEEMKKIKSGSVDLILTDPPYGTIKGMKIEGYVKSNRDTTWDDTIDFDKMFSESNRILRGGGRLILFGQEPFSSRLATFFGSPEANNVEFNYRMIWIKDHFANSLLCKKAPVSYFEDILVFTKKYDWNHENPLREYAKKYHQFIGLTRKEIEEVLGDQKLEHFIRYTSSQFGIPTDSSYKRMVEKWDASKQPWFLTYEELKKQWDEYQKPTFNLPENKKFKSNILEYPKDRGGWHPTQKPVALLEDLIKTYSNPENTVLDFTMGSGSTGIACINTNRKFIGIERDDEYFEKAKKRIEDHANNSQDQQKPTGILDI